MTCEHTHKGDPENAICEDCYWKPIEKPMIKLVQNLMKEIKWKNK